MKIADEFAMNIQIKTLFSSLCLALSLSGVAASTQAADREFLNVSYDATREFYDEFNDSFGQY